MNKGKYKLKDAVIAITYQCNSRCRMCNIWKRQENFSDLRPADFNHLPSSLSSINISGGEPFLHPQMVAIVQAIKGRCPKAGIIISSNGFATELILSKTKELLKIDPAIGVAISLDGIGEKHDEIRGIPGGYQKALATLEKLKRMGIKNLKIGFTLGDYNWKELKKVSALADKLKVELSLAVVHSSENYFGKANTISDLSHLTKELDWVIQKELATWKPKHWARAFFAQGAKVFLQTGKRILPDYSGKMNIFVNPFGNIYPCDVATEKIGKINPFFVEKADRQKECENSWMVCTARQAMKKHWFKVGSWIMVHKFLKK